MARKRKEIVVNDRVFKVENKPVVRSNVIKCKTLDDVYKSYSYAKAKAWEYCKWLCNLFSGKNLSVVGHNCMMFSASFDFEYEGEKYLMYITKSYDRVYKVA